jgi:hypothetical protein
MNTQKSIKNIVTLGALLFLGLGIGCSHTPEAKADRVVKKIEHRLDLNSQQKSELDKLKAEALADYHGMKSERETLADEIQKQLESGKLDRAELKKMAADSREKRASITDKWIDNLVTFHEGLDAKQKEIVLKDVKKMRKEMHED